MTRTPTSRASAGLVAAARIASPIFVNWKSNQRAPTAPSETTIVPMSCSETVTPAICIVSLGNGLSTALTSPDQIHVISAVPAPATARS